MRHGGDIIGLACSSDSSLVFVSHTNGRVRSWRLSNLLPVVAEFKRDHQWNQLLTRLVTDGKFLVGWGENVRRFANVIVWETATCRQLWSIAYGCCWNAPPAVDWSTERMYVWEWNEGLVEYDLLKVRGSLFSRTFVYAVCLGNIAAQNATHWECPNSGNVY